jgi:hypothetical protein
MKIYHHGIFDFHSNSLKETSPARGSTRTEVELNAMMDAGRNEQNDN